MYLVIGNTIVVGPLMDFCSLLLKDPDFASIPLVELLLTFQDMEYA
jgi:hypothetical protein